jgi:hypothetical protein
MTDDHTHRGDDVHPVEAAEREAEGGWIKTPPMNGTWVNLLMDGFACSGVLGTPDFIIKAKWSDQYKTWVSDEDVWPEDRVIEWQPLPAAPTDAP